MTNATHVIDVGRPQKRSRLLDLGLPRDPAAPRHAVGFLVTTVATVLVTRVLLAATGYPQLGGDGLHIAHVLWGGLVMALALLVLVSFAGPAARPLGAVLGGIGFGLFIDEIGKFLTDDNDYFYEPAPALIYGTVVVLTLAADRVHRRRPHHPSEYLAGAADLAVAGIAGGLTARARAEAGRLADLGHRAPQAAQVKALLAAIPDDEAELLDPVDVVARRIAAVTDRATAAGWATALSAALLAGSVTVSTATLLPARAAPQGVGWLVTASALGILAVLAIGGLGLIRLRRNRPAGVALLRRAALVSLLLVQVAGFRFDPGSAVAGVLIDLALLAVLAAESARVRRAAGGGS